MKGEGGSALATFLAKGGAALLLWRGEGREGRKEAKGPKKKEKG